MPGCIVFGSQVIRLDIVERLGAILRKCARNGAFPINAEMLSLVGLSQEGITPVLVKLGYQQLKSADGEVRFRRHNQKYKRKPQFRANKSTETSWKKTGSLRKTQRPHSEKAERLNPSPFSVLEQIKLVH